MGGVPGSVKKLVHGAELDPNSATCTSFGNLLIQGRRFIKHGCETIFKRFCTTRKFLLEKI
jgi:hypothetical protein